MKYFFIMFLYLSSCMAEIENNDLDFIQYYDESEQEQIKKPEDKKNIIIDPDQCETSNPILHGCYFNKDSVKDKPMPAMVK